MITHDVVKRASVAASAIADCPFSIAQEYAEDFLQSAGPNGPRAMIRLPLPPPLRPLTRRVRIDFSLHVDTAEGGRVHDEVRFRWSSGSTFLPDFRGVLRFRIEGSKTVVLIDGSYRAPFGLLGRGFDAIAGRRIANATVRDLALHVASYLTDRQRLWTNAMAAVEAVEPERAGG